MNNYQLECVFKTQGEKNFTLRLYDVKQDLDASTVTGVMDRLIEDQLFGKEDIIASKMSANLIETKKTALL